MCMLLVDMSDDVLNEKNAALVLKTLYEFKEPVFVSALQEVVKNYHVLKNTIAKLIDSGFVTGEEVEIKGRKALKVSLTEKGRAVAEKLKEVEEISRADEKYLELSKRMKIFVHLNTYEDHLTVMELQGGRKRIANIFPKRKGKYLYLWCDIDEDYNCDHIYYALHDIYMRDTILKFAEKEGLELAPIYEDGREE